MVLVHDDDLEGILRLRSDREQASSDYRQISDSFVTSCIVLGNFPTRYVDGPPRKVESGN